MTNFDFLASTRFCLLLRRRGSAERLLHIDIDACVLNCRWGMEFG